MASLPSWLRPPKSSPDGTMALLDHLRELRYRFIISLIGLVIVAIGALVFLRQIMAIIMKPGVEARLAYQRANPDTQVQFTLNNVTDPFSLNVWVIVVAAIILSCPIWLYQLWAYIAPALLKTEKKVALLFISAAVPLFLSGCTLGYFVLPQGIAVLLGFTPSGFGVANLLEVRRFLTFELMMILVFGASFLLPVIIVSLNLAGVVRAYQLQSARKMVIFGTVVFAAVATPSTDPFSMLALATPMTVLYFISEVICRIIDKRRGITKESAKEFVIDLDDGK